MFSVPLAWVQLFLRGWEVGDFYVHDVDAGTAAWENGVRLSSRGGGGGREVQFDRRAKNIVLMADPSMPAEPLRCEQTRRFVRGRDADDTNLGLSSHRLSPLVAL